MTKLFWWMSFASLISRLDVLLQDTDIPFQPCETNSNYIYKDHFSGFSPYTSCNSKEVRSTTTNRQQQSWDWQTTTSYWRVWRVKIVMAQLLRWSVFKRNSLSIKIYKNELPVTCNTNSRLYDDTSQVERNRQNSKFVDIPMIPYRNSIE